MVYENGPNVILQRLAEHASRYGINLNGFVSKGKAPSVQGGFACVFLGTLQLQKAKATIKRFANNSFLGDDETMKVN